MNNWPTEAMWHVPGQLIDTTFVKVPRSHNSREANKRMQSYAVSDTAVDDSQVFEPLLDESEDAEGKKRAVYADSAYRCNEREQTLGANGFDSQIHETWHAGSSAARRAKGRKQSQIADAGAGKACVRCSARDGRTRRAHDWPGACEGENWGAESGLQHEAPGAAGQTRCVGCDGASQPSRQSCMRSGLTIMVVVATPDDERDFGVEGSR